MDGLERQSLSNVSKAERVDGEKKAGGWALRHF